PCCLHSFPTRRSSDLNQSGFSNRLSNIFPPQIDYACLRNLALRQLDNFDTAAPCPNRNSLPNNLYFLKFRCRAKTNPNLAHTHLDRKSTRLNSSHVKI